MRFDKIYIDIDSDPYNPSLKVPRAIVKYIESNYGGKPRVYYSGCKGWHVYIDFSAKITLKHAKSFKLFVLQLVDKLKMNPEEVDTSVLGDKERLSRLPFTLNYGNLLLAQSRAPRLCIPVDVDWDISDVEYESRFCSFRKLVDVCPINERELGDELTSLDKLIEARYRHLEKVSDKSSPEIAEENLKKLTSIAQKIKNGRHRLINFIIIPHLIEMGKSTSEIHEFCREFIEATGENYAKYSEYADRCITRNRLGPEGNGESPWKPLSWERFLLANLDILKYFSREGGEE
jgi:DNA primase catalytic subunit